jgi:UDP-N-acetylmuramate dehydrogenase
MANPATAARIRTVLEQAFGADRIRESASLAAFTTFRTGGPADWLLETRRSEELLAAIRLAATEQLPLTILGGGSNVLIGDRGIRGLVVHVHHGAIAQVDSNGVRADAGVTINGLVRWTINRGLGGLEAWAGTPGTVGGAVYGNAHFDGRLIGDLITSVGLVARDGHQRELPQSEMEFGYDQSRLQRTGEILLWAEFRVSRDSAERLRATARRSLADRKRTQPLYLPSAGCIFQNPDPTRDVIPPGLPPSAGALIDRAGLKGRAIGRARISAVHANFIVNEGEASSSDILALIALCKQTVLDRFGIELREEIVRMGEF